MQYNRRHRIACDGILCELEDVALAISIVSAVTVRLPGSTCEISQYNWGSCGGNAAGIH